MFGGFRQLGRIVLSLAAFSLFLAIPAALAAAAEWWFREGYVEAGPPGTTLRLVGAADDEINIKLRLPAGAAPDKEELSVELRDQQSGFRAVSPVSLHTNDADDDDLTEFFVTLTVPETPPGANLSGFLTGSYVSGAIREAFQVPLSVRVVDEGEARASGFKDMRWQHRVELVAKVAFLTVFALIVCSPVIGVFVAVRATRQRPGGPNDEP